MVNEPRMAMPPMATGIQAAPRLPKIRISRISRTGIEKASARAMLAVTSELMATSVATLPPAVAVSPAAARLAGVSLAWMAS